MSRAAFPLLHLMYKANCRLGKTCKYAINHMMLWGSVLVRLLMLAGMEIIRKSNCHPFMVVDLKLK